MKRSESSENNTKSSFGKAKVERQGTLVQFVQLSQTSENYHPSSSTSATAHVPESVTFVAVKMQDDFRSVVMSKENVSHSSSQSSLWTSMVAENHHVSHISTVPEHYSHRETMIMIEVLLVHTGRK